MTLLVAVALATTYLTYVVTRSSFPLIGRIRAQVFRRWGGSSWQGYLATCAWCVSFYIAAGVTVATMLTTDVAQPALIWLAACTVTGVVLEIVDALQDSHDRS